MNKAKESVKNVCKNVGGYIKENRGKICFILGAGIGAYIGYYDGLFTTCAQIKINVPDAWEIISKHYSA